MDRAARRANTDPLGGGGDGGSCNPSVLVVEVAMITGSRAYHTIGCVVELWQKCGRTTDRLLEIQRLFEIECCWTNIIMLSILSIVFSL